ncbi:HD domain-containing protein [Corallococcus sp. AS-1-12]|uniref:HD domain-containing protein n=1 Tax=Corallococcus sp. AS-1-12 TaxID=2874598 RepID=UPI001CC0F1C4|nr:HD domain-containing protein [Corallococcus sp. AS-1-12]MBZ4336410.1 HD domain-containing protein [Corallococcus sp. AS-1-12]
MQDQDSTPHLLDLTKSILDPIHGLIRFTENETKVINDPVYQRLRKIKQNGLLHFVFPSATHTRFEHSLGVLFVADSMLRSLLFNSISSTSKQRITDAANATPGQAIDLNTVPRATLKELFRVTRLAALVHDLGHGPFSHTFDRFAPSLDAVLKMLHGGQLPALSDFEDTFRAYAAKNNHIRAPHEIMSCVFFAHIWQKIDAHDLETPKAITAAILGETAFGFVGSGLAPWVPLIHDLVASAPADADRMDYLERDSRSCGVSYGLFDRNRLLKTMLCYKASNGQYRLGLKSSGFRAVENFIQARYELFVQVYYHKTNRAIESMLQHISALAGSTTHNIISENSLNDLIRDYVNLGDDIFLDILRGQGGHKKVDSPAINEIAQQIHDRQLWKRVADSQDNRNLDASTQESILQKLKATFPDVTFHLDKIKAAAAKDLNSGAVILNQDSTGIYSADQAAKWESYSRIIATLSKTITPEEEKEGKEEEHIRRIYVQTADSSKAKSIRAALRKDLSTPGEAENAEQA